MRARGPVGYTCPKIDDCISSVQSAIDQCEDPGKLEDLLGNNGLLERIRSDNIALRDWGAEQEDLAEDLQRQVTHLERLLDNAESECTDLRKQVEQMEDA